MRSEIRAEKRAQVKLLRLALHMKKQKMMTHRKTIRGTNEMEIYFIRHGETEWNRKHQLQGRSDIPLNDTGLAEARKLARYFRDTEFDKVYTSPLARARKTAEIIMKDREPKPVEVSELREMSFGVGEGMNLSGDPISPELRNLKDFFSAPEKYQPPKGGESVEEVTARCKAFIDNYLIPDEPTCKRVLAVAHGGIIRGMESVVLGLPKAEFWTSPIIPNCGAVVLSLKDGHLSITKTIDIIGEEEKSFGRF